MATITYKCPNCDAGLIFDPDSQTFKCEYCLTEYAEQKLREMEAAKARDQVVTDQQNPNQTALLYTCPSCGAEVVTDETTASTFCYYCHNPVVLSGKLEGGFTPDYVVPFQIDKEKAVSLFQQWIGKKKYIPKAFYSPQQMEKMAAIYFPYLLYSCKVDGQMQADATNVRVWSSGNVQYTETKRYDVSRQGTMEIQNLTRNALRKANKQLVEGVLPFPIEQMKPFHMGYLSGFQAERRDMEQAEFVSQVEAEVKSFAQDQLRASIGQYQTVKVQQHREAITEPRWKYALMPVWVLTYKDKAESKLYYFALNGFTGKICGVLPVDYKRLSKLFALVFIPVFLFFLIGGYLIG